MKYSICCILCLLPAIAGDFFVSPQGNDQNTGSKQGPFKSIHKAIAASALTTEHDTISVANGHYVLDKTITINHSNITINAANPGQVTFSGGVKIQGF